MNFQQLYNVLDEVDNEPYPKIENIKPNYNFGRMVYDSYSGSYGELTAILQYVYEDITNKDNSNLERVLMRIAMDEMKHFKILGELLVELGFIPYYMGSRNNKWCSDNVKYKFYSTDEMLKYNIEGEKDAIREYKNLIELTDQKCIKNLLRRIIKDEENHIKIFNSLQSYE